MAEEKTESLVQGTLDEVLDKKTPKSPVAEHVLGDYSVDTSKLHKRDEGDSPHKVAQRIQTERFEKKIK